MALNVRPCLIKANRYWLLAFRNEEFRILIDEERNATSEERIFNPIYTDSADRFEGCSPTRYYYVCVVLFY